MQPVRTKQATPHGRKRTLFIALAALVLIAVAAVCLLRAPKPETPENGGKQAVLTLLDHEEDQLERITVCPSRSEAYTLVRIEAGMILENRPDFPLREETVRVLVYYATHLTADEIAIDTGTVKTSHQGGLNLSEYGLEPGTCSAEVALNSGETYTVTLGNAVPMEETRYYACVSGNPNIYTVTSDVMDALNVQFYTLHPVTALSVSADLIDRVTVTNQSGDTAFLAERRANGWRLTEPLEYPLSETAMSAMLTAMEGIRFSTWVGEDTPENRHAYGFDNPRRTLSIDFAPSVLTVPDEEGAEQIYDIPASNITIMQGDAYSETADYYLYNGQIMTGTVVSFSFLKDFSWQKYISKTPFVYGQNNLSEVTVTVGDTVTEYTVSYTERVLPNNEFETDEYGNILYEMRVKKNGRTMDAYAFSEYYEKLAGLTGAVMMYDNETGESAGSTEPLVSVRILPEDRTEQMVIALYPDSTERDSLTLNGVTVYSVPTSWKETILTLP